MAGIDVATDFSSATAENEGNFRETLRLMTESGDTILMTHLETSASNAQYTSGSIQNELLECIGKEIQHGILEKVGSCGPYSIMFDETTDASHTSIMSFVVRYIDTSGEKSIVREDFLDFMDTYRTLGNDDSRGGTSPDQEICLTGENLGYLVLAKMKMFSLDLRSCVGIATDGCSVMISNSRGAVNAIKREAINAERCLCYNHALNLSLEKSSKTPEVRNTLSLIQEVVSFFTMSAKRNRVLIQATNGQLKSPCRTRWVEKYQAVNEFSEKYPKIIESLECIERWNDQASSSKAYSLIASLTRFEILVTLYILQDIFSTAVPVSSSLQGRQLDLRRADELIDDTIAVLKARWENAATHFAGIFAACARVAGELNIPHNVPRRAGQQIHRSNHPTSSAEEFYRVSVYIPVLD